MKKLRKILLRFLALLIFLLLAAWIFIQTPFGQNWIIGKVTKRLSKDLKTTVSVKHVDFSLFNRMHLEGVLIEDLKKDTLIYAGDLNVRITDWFFIKDKVELKYIGLEDAVIKFNRTDSVWNNQFLFDYLSSPSTPDKKNKEGGTELNLKKVLLKNILFVTEDKWLGETQRFKIKELNLDARDINFKTKTVDIASLKISEPFVAIINYPKLKTTASVSKEKDPAPDSLLKWNAAGWMINLDKLVLDNGTFKTDKNADQPLAYFDGKHILFTEIDGLFTNLKWTKDTITAQMELKAKERSGLEVKKMTARAKFTPQLMEFANMDLQTNQSRLADYYSMSYESFDDFGTYLSDVRMTGDFKKAEINSDDIALFAPALKNWKKIITLSGRIKGTVDDINADNLLISAGKNTMLNGDISLTGLPDIYTTFIDFKSNDFRTTYTDAVKLIPSLRKVKSPDLSSLTYIRFKGNFTGFLRDFVAFGTTETNLGTVVSDINMKLPPGKNPVYSGNISSAGFDIGKFLRNEVMGTIALNAKLSGTGISKNVNADIDGKIHSFVYNNYHYENIDVEGKLNDRLFEGKFISKDSNAVFTATGTVDFNKSKPTIKLDAEIQDIQFQKLRIAKENFAFTGKLEFDFTGDNIDDFTGTAKIRNGRIHNDGEEIAFEKIILRTEMINGEKKLTLESDEIDGSVTGLYNLNDLPASITLFLNKYYPSLIPAPKKQPVNQCFVFDITTRNIDGYLKLLNKNLGGFNESRVTGKLNMDESKLELNAGIPYFSVNGIAFSEARLNGEGNNEKLILKGHASGTKINDSISLKATDFTIEAANDISRVKILTASNKEIDAANINAVVSTFSDGFKIKFDSSYFDVNGKTWNIDPNGELEFRSKVVTNSQLTMREGQQEIMFSTEPSSEGNYNDLKVVLKKLNLGDISPFILPKNSIEGMASGEIIIEDPAGKFNITSDLSLEKIRFDNDSVGNLKTSITYDNKTGIISGKGINDDPAHKIDMDLLWHLNKSDNDKENYILLGPENYPIKILERFIGSLFTDLSGYATGKIKIGGKGNRMNYTGKARLHDAGLKVLFTQCFYKIEDTEIELRENDINLDGIILRDPVTDNPIYLDGNISHYSFDDMFFDIRVQTRKPYTSGKTQNLPILLLNTTYNDNKQFYGKAYGTGSLQLFGPQEDMFMHISAIASDKDSSYITIPPSRSRESGEADFLVERKFGREMSVSGNRKSATNIIFDADITATPLVNMKVQIDDLTNDEIKGRGEGTLNIRSGTTEPLTIRGRYNIVDGDYKYTFRSKFARPFVVKKGVGVNNYIEWYGDPYKAKVNFEAIYTAQRVSFAPLVTGYSINTNLGGLREDVTIAATMTNELFNPKFDFKILFKDDGEARRDPALSFNISQIEKNQNELNRQVTFLLVFNSFAPPEFAQRTGLGSALNELLYNSISGIIFSEVNNIINQALYKIFKTDKIKLDISGNLYNRNILNAANGNSSLGLNQGNININLPVSFFKDRLIINAGLSSDISLQSSASVNGNRVLFLPNITIELLLNPSGSLRATLFYRENPDFLSQTSRSAKRQGVGVTYRREADRFWELFGFGKNRKQISTTLFDKQKEKK